MKPDDFVKLVEKAEKGDETAKVEVLTAIEKANAGNASAQRHLMRYVQRKITFGEPLYMAVRFWLDSALERFQLGASLTVAFKPNSKQSSETAKRRKNNKKIATKTQGLLIVKAVNEAMKKDPSLTKSKIGEIGSVFKLLAPQFEITPAALKDRYYETVNLDDSENGKISKLTFPLV